MHLDRVPNELRHHQDARHGAENQLDDRNCDIPRLCCGYDTANRDVEKLYI